MFKNEIATTTDPQVKQAVQQGEPVIRQHTEMADQLAQQENVPNPVAGQNL